MEKSKKPKRVLNFIKMREFIRIPDIKPLEKCVLFDLLFYAGTESNAFPSEARLGKDFNRSDRHIRTTLLGLRRKGWLLGWKRRGYSKSNEYELNPELYFRNDSSLRKPFSVHSGTILPVQSGTPFPPKVSHESNQLSSSHIQQLFEETSKNNCSPTDRRRLHDLCKRYSEPWVEDAIKEASTRRYSYLGVGLVQKILEDWKQDGKPQPKPKFIPCGQNGCKNGLIPPEANTNAYIICLCRERFSEELKQWKKLGIYE